ncbi:MAG TPA: Zn-dependent alcohol dehydrogenase [Acidimicrobiales bacterium]|nr:Zn-dependent alcohol dehydrogenase [Acidimicrobiales bacterium]
MKAVVYNGQGIEVSKDVEVRDPRATEVKVKIGAAGLCHSDLSVIERVIEYPPPAVLGHEGAGVVEAVGSAVTEVQPGDHVVLTTLANCGRCSACARGVPTQCRASLGRISKVFTVGGTPAYNFAGTSVFSEYTVVQAVQAIKIPDEIPFTAACLIGCGVLTGVGAALNRASIRPGQSVAVFGIGGIGLNVIQGARIAGASRIIAVDLLPEKETLARQFGATEFISGADTDVPPVDWAFECVGHPAVVRRAVDALDWGGTCVVLGVPPPGAEVSIPINHLAYVDRGIIGCRYGSARPHHDVPLMVDLYQRGELLLDELVSRTYPLEDVELAISDLKSGALARGVMVP